MILELSQLLRRHRQIPLKELAEALNADPASVRLMLQRLIRRGQVEKLPQGTLCAGGCHLCAPDSIEIYRWIGDNKPDSNQSKQGVPKCAQS